MAMQAKELPFSISRSRYTEVHDVSNIIDLVSVKKNNTNAVFQVTGSVIAVEDCTIVLRDTLTEEVTTITDTTYPDGKTRRNSGTTGVIHEPNNTFLHEGSSIEAGKLLIVRPNIRPV